MESDDWFTLAELTKRLGALAWAEAAVADVLASWVAVEAADAAVIHFARAGRHHAWHAEVVRSCLPTSPELVDPTPVRSPSDGWDDAVATLQRFVDPAATGTRLRALDRVIDPWFGRETGALLDLARPVSDTDLVRWLRFVALDHDQDRSRTTELLAVHADEPVHLGDHQLLTGLERAVRLSP